MKSRTFNASILMVAAFSCLFSAGIARADLLEDLIGYWPLDGDLTDQGPLGGHDGTFVNEGASQFVPAVHGDGIDLDGVNAYITTDPAVEADFDFLNQDFSFAAWFRVDGFTKSWQMLLGKGEGQRWRVHRRGGENVMTWNGGNNDVPQGPTNVNDGEFHHIAGVSRQGESVTLWIDGVLEATGPAPQNTNNNNSQPFMIGNNPDSLSRTWDGVIDEVGVWGRALEDAEIIGLANGDLIGGPVEPFTINGRGQTYTQDFDEMETGKRMPKGWTGEDNDGSGRSIDSFGLIDGPLEGPTASAAGILNLGGNPSNFTTPDPAFLATWTNDNDGNGLLDDDDVIDDGATDRALGVGRVLADDLGSLNFEIEITGSPLRAFTAEWDLEVWGADPEAAFRGSEGGGFAADISVGGNSYFSNTVSLVPGDLFNSTFDGAPGATNDPTLINGNEHAVRGNATGIVEVSSADGAVGNLLQLSLNGDHGGDDGGWISAVDNVQIRALAAGDAQADGDVDPADLIQLLAGGAFGQGNIDATWGQGDFDNDGDFDGTDILAVVQGLAGEFPKTYAHDPSNGVPDVLINPATGNITLDTNGTTIGSIVMDSAAGIFNGPNSPSWDAPGDFAADIDTQISMPISFTNPGYTGVDDLGDGIIGDLAPGFDILADLTIKYLDPNGDLLDAEAHVVPEPSSIIIALLGLVSLMVFSRCRNSLAVH